MHDAPFVTSTYEKNRRGAMTVCFVHGTMPGTEVESDVRLLDSGHLVIGSTLFQSGEEVGETQILSFAPGAVEALRNLLNGE